MPASAVKIPTRTWPTPPSFTHSSVEGNWWIAAGDAVGGLAAEELPHQRVEPREFQRQRADNRQVADRHEQPTDQQHPPDGADDRFGSFR
jgi:hypothetical protein